MTYHSHPGSTVPSVVIPRRSFAMESAYDAEKKTITAVVATYSIDSARPVTKPPHGPIAARPNEEAPPVCGIAEDIAPMAKISPEYMTMRMAKAMSIPPKPPNVNPAFHPEKSPEITAATARPQSPHTPSARGCRRFSKQPLSTRVYVAPDVFRVSFDMNTGLLIGSSHAGRLACST